MTCKDCLHYEACNKFIWKEMMIIESVADFVCGDYKDKSRFVELPCKVGDKFYTPIRGEVCEFKCIGFVYGYGKISLIEPSGRSFLLNEEAFLTREEAEKALAEREEK